jgi:hypothetical protein
VIEIRVEGSSPLKNFITLGAADTAFRIALTFRPGPPPDSFTTGNEAAVRGAMFALFLDPGPDKWL